MRNFTWFGSTAATFGHRAVLVVAAACAATLALSGTASAGTSIAPAWGLLILAGLASGLLAGMLGIGGALVTAPALYAALPALGAATGSLAQAVVAATLLTMVPTTIAVMHFQARRGSIDLPSLRRFAPAMTFGATVGGLLALQLHGSAIPLAFAAQALCYGAWLMVREPADRIGPVGRWLGRQSPWWTASTVAGFCACVGMGGASMVTPYLRCRALALKAAVATSSALNLCIAVGGSVAFVVAAGSSAGPSLMLSGVAAVVLATFAMLAAPWGVAIAHRLPLRSFSVLVGAINVIGAVALLGHVMTSQGDRPAQATRHLAEASGWAAERSKPERAAAIAEEAASKWRRLALHALLIPLIEPEGEPEWAVPHELMPCIEDKIVTMDGRPIPHGRLLPLERPIVVAFRLKDCWPLGEHWLGLTGSVEMTVVRQQSRLLVQVRPLLLEGVVRGARTPLTETFVDVVALGIARKEKRPARLNA